MSWYSFALGFVAGSFGSLVLIGLMMDCGRD